MPEIQLTRAEEKGKLPNVCMCCGEPATERIIRHLPMHEPIVEGPSGFAVLHALRVLVAIAETPHLDLPTTFCAKHRHFWNFRTALNFGGLAGMIAVICLGMGFVLLLIFVAKVDKPWISLCVIVPFLAYTIPFCILAARTARQTIKLRLTEKEAIVLCNVDVRYIAAVEQQRSQAKPAEPAMPATAVTGAIPVAALAGQSEESEPPRRSDLTQRGKPNQTLILVATLLGSVLVLCLLGTCVVRVGSMVTSLMTKMGDGNPERDFIPGTVVPNVAATAPMPEELKNRASIDLIPLINGRKDIVHGKWLVDKDVLHCNDGNFVPRVQFPYLPPEEYDFIVTFLQPGLRNGISLIMPNPHGGSFFWFLGSDAGSSFGFHANPDKRGSIENVIRGGIVHTTKVEVRKKSVRAFVDGKELMHVETDFRDLMSDQWRKLRDDRFPAVACDDATVFYYVRIVEVTGRGRKAR